MNVPVVEPVQVKVEVPAPVTLVGLSVHVRPTAGEIVVESDTRPPNPLSAVTEIVEVPLPPAVKVNDVGLAAIVKS